MLDIQELIKQYSEVINNLSGGNHFLAATLSVAAMGFAYRLYSWLPKTYYFIKRQFIMTLELNSDARDTNYVVYTNFVSWHSTSKYLERSKNFTIIDLSNSHSGIFRFQDRSGSDDAPVEAYELTSSKPKKYNYQLVAGYGLHWFFLDKRFFWFNRAKNGGGNENGLTTENITLHTFALNKNAFSNLIDKFTPEVVENTKQKYLEVFKNSGIDSSWHNHYSSNINIRKLSTVFINTEVKNSVIKRIEDFYANREWYINNGISHKLVISLSGESGTGKSSFIKALASEYASYLYKLNLSLCNDTDLENLLGSLVSREKSFIAIEDIDSVSAVLKRSTKLENSASIKSKHGSLTLSGVLNALDGIIPLDNTVVFITTNHYESLDEALRRKGRMDINYELQLLSDKEIKEYIFAKYNLVVENMVFQDIKGCDLESIFLQNLFDPKGFINELKTTPFKKLVGV